MREQPISIPRSAETESVRARPGIAAPQFVTRSGRGLALINSLSQAVGTFADVQARIELRDQRAMDEQYNAAQLEIEQVESLYAESLSNQDDASARFHFQRMLDLSEKYAGTEGFSPAQRTKFHNKLQGFLNTHTEQVNAYLDLQEKQEAAELKDKAARLHVGTLDLVSQNSVVDNLSKGGYRGSELVSQVDRLVLDMYRSQAMSAYGIDEAQANVFLDNEEVIKQITNTTDTIVQRVTREYDNRSIQQAKARTALTNDQVSGDVSLSYGDRYTALIANGLTPEQADSRIRSNQGRSLATKSLNNAADLTIMSGWVNDPEVRLSESTISSLGRRHGEDAIANYIKFDPTTISSGEAMQNAVNLLNQFGFRVAYDDKGTPEIIGDESSKYKSAFVEPFKDLLRSVTVPTNPKFEGLDDANTKWSQNNLHDAYLKLAGEGQEAYTTFMGMITQMDAAVDGALSANVLSGISPMEQIATRLRIFEDAGGVAGSPEEEALMRDLGFATAMYLSHSELTPPSLFSDLTQMISFGGDAGTEFALTILNSNPDYLRQLDFEESDDEMKYAINQELDRRNAGIPVSDITDTESLSVSERLLRGRESFAQMREVQTRMDRLREEDPKKFDRFSKSMRKRMGVSELAIDSTSWNSNFVSYVARSLEDGKSQNTDAVLDRAIAYAKIDGYKVALRNGPVNHAVITSAPAAITAEEIQTYAQAWKSMGESKLLSVGPTVSVNAEDYVDAVLRLNGNMPDRQVQDVRNIMMGRYANARYSISQNPGQMQSGGAILTVTGFNNENVPIDVDVVMLSSEQLDLLRTQPGKERWFGVDSLPQIVGTPEGASDIVQSITSKDYLINKHNRKPLGSDFDRPTPTGGQMPSYFYMGTID